MELSGKRVFLTGAGGGLGRELARSFGRRGASLILTDCQERPLAAASANLRQEGYPVEHFVLDVTDPDAVARLPERVGALDVLANNAGVVFGGRFTDVPMEEHRLTLRVNLHGLMAVTHALLPGLIARPQASLLNVASATAFAGLPRASSYAASKWAVLGFAESLRMELRQEGHRHVRFTTACPGYIDTAMFAGARPPRTTRVLAAEKAAEAIVKAVAKEKLWVRIPWLVKTGPFLRGVLPTPAFDALSRAFGVPRSMEGWRGHQA